MKKRILPILMIVFNYIYIYSKFIGFNIGFSEMLNDNIHKYISCFLIVIYILNTVNSFYLLKHGENCKTLLFWDIILKLFNIPLYIFVFWLGIILALVPLGFLYIFFLVFIDYLLLLASSMYGVSGLIKAYREKKITIVVLIVNIILHFIFCLDVISAVVMYIIVKRKDKNQSIVTTDNEHTEKYEHFFDILEKSDKLLIHQAKDQDIDICHIELVTSFVDPRVDPYICIFFNTDLELEKYKQNGTTRLIEDLYNKILSSLDSQSYNFSFEFDSEENVNKNYAGSYFYRMR